jgi:DNA-binding MarR family transcriptional regulator
MPQLGFALRRRAGDLPEALRAAGGIGGPHMAVLISLAIAGPATVSELGRRLDMTPAHSSLVVGELARAQFVAREHDPGDRRRILVSLAEAAKPVVSEMRARNAAPLARFLAALSEEEAEGFITHLARLVACLDSGDQRPPGPSLRPG